MTDTFTVDVNDAGVLLALENGAKRMRYAIANAERATILKVQAAERQAVRSGMFQLRKKEFIEREAAIISPFPKADTLFTRVRVGDKPRLLLSKFEAGAQRTGFVGRNVAVPIIGAARPTRQSGIAPNLTFSAMKLREFQGGKKLRRKARGRHVRDFTTFREYGRLLFPESSPKSQWKGASRTYLVPGVGVFQRTGPGSTRLVWAFRPSVRIPATLGFVKRARVIAEREFPKDLRAQVIETLRYQIARGSGLA